MVEPLNVYNYETPSPLFLPQRFFLLELKGSFCSNFSTNYDQI